MKTEIYHAQENGPLQRRTDLAQRLFKGDIIKFNETYYQVTFVYYDIELSKQVVKVEEIEEHIISNGLFGF
jgi:hypothetical protein